MQILGRISQQNICDSNVTSKLAKHWHALIVSWPWCLVVRCIVPHHLMNHKVYTEFVKWSTLLEAANKEVQKRAGLHTCRRVIQVKWRRRRWIIFELSTKRINTKVAKTKVDQKYAAFILSRGVSSRFSSSFINLNSDELDLLPQGSFMPSLHNTGLLS